MPKATTAPPPPAPPLGRASLRSSGAPLAGAALYAALEIGAAIGLLGFFALGRAEALLFLALRPWLLILAAASVSGWPWHRRYAFYGLALALAATGETILVLALGASEPWREMLGGLAAGAAMALVADLLVQALRRRWGLGGVTAAVLGLFALLAWGGALRPYEALALGPTAAREAVAPRPRLLLMTSLPIVWGTGGAFDPGSRPAHAYRVLEREFDLRPIDAIEPPALVGAGLMLLAQPRLLAPEELVALDDWVRRGGQVLILTDPSLAAARELPPLDPRRPPERGLLAPLLDHWGVRLDPGPAGVREDVLPQGGRRHRLIRIHPGRLTVERPPCRRAGRDYIVRCRIGNGEALIVADADLLTDAAWTAREANRAGERHLRTADNPLIVAGWLDSLAGVRRERSDLPVAWIAPGADRGGAVLLACVPIALALALGIALLYSNRRSTDLSTASKP